MIYLFFNLFVWLFGYLVICLVIYLIICLIIEAAIELQMPEATRHHVQIMDHAQALITLPAVRFTLNDGVLRRKLIISLVLVLG